MKLIELLTLRKIFAPQAEKSIPAQLAYKLYKIIACGEQEEKFYIEHLNKIIETYAECDADGKVIADEQGVKMDESRKDEWQKQVDELQNIDVDCSVSFTIDELSPLEFSIAEMSFINKYITEG